MKRSTRMAAWFWVAVAVYMLINDIVPLNLSGFGVNWSVGRYGHMLNISALLALIGALGILMRQAWGWWLMVAYGVASIALGISLAMDSYRIVHGPPVLACSCVSLVILLWLSAIVLIVLDPPWRWRRISQQIS